MSRRRAISPIGTGPDEPVRASSASARTAYGDFEVMVSTARPVLVVAMALVARRPDLWLPPVALMGLIFFLSAQPDLSSGLGGWDILLRKLAHASIYAVLVLLWWRALRAGGGDDETR